MTRPPFAHVSVEVVDEGRLFAVRVARLDHVQSAMPAGLEADPIAFYEGVLGIPHVPKPGHLAARGGCWFENGDLKVHLGVDDVRGIATAVASAGFAVNDDEPLDGFDRVYVSDA